MKLYVVTYYNGERDDWDVATGRDGDEAIANCVKNTMESLEIDLNEVENQSMEAFPIEHADGYQVKLIKKCQFKQTANPTHN